MSSYALKLEAELPRLRSTRSRVGRKALRNAAEYFVLLAEIMAWQIEHDIVSPCDGAQALRLFVSIMRAEG